MDIVELEKAIKIPDWGHTVGDRPRGLCIPEAAAWARNRIKIIYGMEGYWSTTRNRSTLRRPLFFEERPIAVDIETTGFNPRGMNF